MCENPFFFRFFSSFLAGRGRVAGALKAVPGKVIVIVESCGSGAGVLAPYESNGLTDEVRNAMRDFDHAVIDAFAAVDQGIVVPKSGANTGELRVENKFYVLTASRYQESSWGVEKGSYNFFTKWLTEGVGRSGNMPADRLYWGNNNGIVQLDELYKYISEEGDNTPITVDGQQVYQHVQVYPNYGYQLFR